QNIEYKEASQAGQDFTSMTELKVPIAQQVQDGAQQSSFALVDESGQELASSKTKLAQNLDRSSGVNSARFEVGTLDDRPVPDNMPSIESHKVIEAARNLITDKNRWKGPKCNIFVDESMRGAGVPLPWTKTEAHNCEAMVQKLSKDPRFDLTWQRDGDLKTSRDLWKAFQVNDGDIAIWSNKYLTHTGILERADNNEKNIYYAGSSNEAGANYTDADYFVGSKTKGYGPPDYVFRYRGFRHQD
ncbi:MAG: hypothetical protein K8F91_17875, partial [Candidatus Obscuribacterales bacterium]|nr:hypothetical protein [Candidatus Obscuribacterales bacterium]